MAPSDHVTQLKNKKNSLVEANLLFEKSWVRNLFANASYKINVLM